MHCGLVWKLNPLRAIGTLAEGNADCEPGAGGHAWHPGVVHHVAVTQIVTRHHPHRAVGRMRNVFGLVALERCDGARVGYPQNSHMQWASA